jgi:hypothetical protein
MDIYFGVQDYLIEFSIASNHSSVRERKHSCSPSNNSDFFLLFTVVLFCLFVHVITTIIFPNAHSHIFHMLYEEYARSSLSLLHSTC